MHKNIDVGALFDVVLQRKGQKPQQNILYKLISYDDNLV